MQTSTHFISIKELNRKKVKRGAHPYQFHIFRESLFFKYYFHIVFAAALVFTSQNILEGLYFRLISFYRRLEELVGNQAPL